MGREGGREGGGTPIEIPKTLKLPFTTYFGGGGGGKGGHSIIETCKPLKQPQKHKMLLSFSQNGNCFERMLILELDLDFGFWGLFGSCWREL